ncbi:MAG: SMI1/KNR4 family protein [Bacteroidaceae bacterium]|nr:SMI1/KNR4 family protein [Bacteroidaceae bacterium]
MENFDEIILKLKTKRVELAEGLSDSEVSTIESELGFTFPEDLRQFLQTAVPEGGAFVNWRSVEDVRKRMDDVWEGIAFDIRVNSFWYEGWGEKPASLEDQLRVAEEHYRTYPKLIPIYSHRYMPSSPTSAGNPVFSVYQMDIIYYGYDLASYLEHEFDFRSYESLFSDEHPFRRIEFWSDVVG